MKKHAELVRPKFELAYEYLKKLPEECGSFSKPTGDTLLHIPLQNLSHPRL